METPKSKKTRPTAARPRTQVKKKKAEDSLRYLTVFMDKLEVKDGFLISESLDEAIKSPSEPRKKAEKPNEDTGEKTDPAKKTTFADLQHQIIERIAVHRSLDDVMVLLHTADMNIQFGFSIQPTLKKYAVETYTDPQRRVFSFDREHARDILGALRKARSGIKGINQLLRLLLIGLVSEYDVFLHDIIRIGLTAQQSAAAAINKGLTLQELMDFASIEEAKEFVIEREIDSILHDDHHAQLLAINKLFNISIDTNNPCVKDFLEICERRNLFTHNAGIANSRYLAKCEQFGVDCKSVKVGDKLLVSRAYFQNSIMTIQELTIKLTQYLWRKLSPKERDAADSALNEAAFELLIGDDYKLAERILDYGINHTGTSSDMMRRMMAVNFANAIKLGGDKKRALTELAKYDWSATNIAFEISVAAVKDDAAQVAKLMSKAVKSGEINEASLRIWPAFKTVRSEKIFQDKFKEIFEKDLIVSAALTPVSLSDQHDSLPKLGAAPKAAPPTKH